MVIIVRTGVTNEEELAVEEVWLRSLLVVEETAVRRSSCCP